MTFITSIEDDSLSYIDHAYWEGIIEEINQWGNSVLDEKRDAMFSTAFNYVNDPPYDDGQAILRFGKEFNRCSEAIRFKVMMEKIWNDVARVRSCTNRELFGEGHEGMLCDPADETSPGRDFGNTVCHKPTTSKGFYLYIIATLEAAKNYAYNRSQGVVGLRYVLTRTVPATSSNGGKPEETPSSGLRNSSSKQGKVAVNPPKSISSNPNEGSTIKPPSPLSTTSSLGGPVGASGINKTFSPAIDQLQGINITGHGAFFIARATIFIGRDFTKSITKSLGAPLELFRANSATYLVCGRESWATKHEECRMALEVVDAWIKTIMRQNRYHFLSIFIDEHKSGSDSTLEELYVAACKKSLLAPRTNFDLVPKDAVLLSYSRDVPCLPIKYHNWPQIEITKPGFSGGYFLGTNGDRGKAASNTLGVILIFCPIGHRKYFECQARSHQMLDRYEYIWRERCRMGLEIVRIWAEEGNNYAQHLPGFLDGLKSSNTNMSLEDFYEAAIRSIGTKPGGEGLLESARNTGTGL